MECVHGVLYFKLDKDPLLCFSFLLNSREWVLHVLMLKSDLSFCCCLLIMEVNKQAPKAGGCAS